MLKLRLLLPALCFSTLLFAQPAKNPNDTLPRTDSILRDLKDNLLDNIPQISLDENDMGDGNSQNVSSVLTAGRDPFFNAASFNWSGARFRVRGYDNDNNTTYMNGLPMDNLDNGYTPFGLWGGLNNVMRNRDLNIGLRYNTFAFGDLASSTNIDTRASHQRKQTQFDYSVTNRNYRHRWGFTHSSGLSKKGWAFTVSGSRRWADEGYVSGTYYDGYSYFLGIDKKIGQKHLLSFVGFGAPTENGRQGGAVQEAMDLTGDHYYNPNWGYQVGKKRNASVGKSHQPYFSLSDEYKITDNTVLTVGGSYSFGQRSTTALDWYNAPDPRPDYYRNLPSYQQDPIIRQQMTDYYKANPDALQISWAHLYDVNRGSYETISNANGIPGNVVSGNRSHYIVEERIIDTKKGNFNAVLNTRLSNHVDFTGGASMQQQKNHYFKEIDDLLGGDFYVNLNQFGERDNPGNPDAGQYDLDHPNRILHAGDKYGYDYDMDIVKSALFMQSVFKYNKVDFFIAGEVSQTKFWRTGNVRTGLFPTTSLGKSQTYSFSNYSVKGGITYKINGRNYLYVNALQQTKAPFFENAYIAPRTRNTVQDNLKNENIYSAEAGYILNSPKVRMRITGYFTRFDDQVNVMSFYHDDYANFVNYAISNIDKVHYGGEFGVEAKVMPNVTVNAAAAVGRYYYDSRQHAVVTLDNSAEILSEQTIYSKNFKVAGTPQEAYSFGVTYRSPNFWTVGLTGNWFDEMNLEFNPLRRTFQAVDGVDYHGENWYNIINQTEYKGQFTLDFFGTYSWKLPKSLGFKKAHFLAFNVGVNNILNNKDMITGGYEQLRFDYENKNVDKFPPKIYYGYGLNYFASVAYRF